MPPIEFLGNGLFDTNFDTNFAGGCKTDSSDLLQFFYITDIGQIVINHMSDHPRDLYNNYSEPSPEVLPLVKS